MDDLNTSPNQFPAELIKIGLTGGIGSGKSAVAKILEEQGAVIIDTDAIAHQITGPNGLAMTAIHAYFGQDFINPDNSLNRTKMRELVFNDDQAKLALEGITHPLIAQETYRLAVEAASHKPPYIVFMVPLLIESGQWLHQTPSKIDYLVVVDCPEEAQIKRVQLRNGLSPEIIQKIMQKQASRDQRLKNADAVITNDGDFAHLETQTKLLHQRILADLTRN
jgi:dephospho-CoA kinase